jgi:hypothetical protein
MQETIFEEVSRRAGGEPFLLYRERDNFTAPLSSRNETGKHHIYNPTVDSLANRAVGPVRIQRFLF